LRSLKSEETIDGFQKPIAFGTEKDGKKRRRSFLVSKLLEKKRPFSWKDRAKSGKTARSKIHRKADLLGHGSEADAILYGEGGALHGTARELKIIAFPMHT